MTAVAVAVAAGLGAVLRYVVDRAVTSRSGSAFPAGTMLVNTTGSFVLGLVTGLSAGHGLPGAVALVVGTGLAGGYTTLSTWAWETLALAEAGDLSRAAVNVLGSFALGLAAAAAGLALGAAWS